MGGEGFGVLCRAPFFPVSVEKHLYLQCHVISKVNVRPASTPSLCLGTTLEVLLTFVLLVKVTASTLNLHSISLKT